MHARRSSRARAARPADGASGSGSDGEGAGGARASAAVARALGGRVAEGVVLDDPYLQRGGGGDDGDDDDDDDALSGSEREARWGGVQRRLAGVVAAGSAQRGRCQPRHSPRLLTPCY